MKSLIIIFQIAIITLAINIVSSNPAQATEYQLPKQKILATYDDAYLEEINGLPVLHLKGTPYEMGFQYGVLAAHRIQETMGVLDGFVKNNKDFKVIPLWLFKSLRSIIGSVFWPWFDDVAKNEIRGIVAGAKTKGVKLGKMDLAFLNSVVDLGGIVKPLVSLVDFNGKKREDAGQEFLKIMGLGWLPTNNCDTMAVWGSRTKAGKTFQTRNVDINTGHGFERVPLVVVYKPTGGVPYVTAAFSGVIGIFTGMNAYGVGLGQVWGFSKKVALANPWVLQIKTIFSQATSALDATLRFQKQRRWTYGSNFVFADAAGMGLAVEVNAKRFEVFKDNDPKEDLALFNGERYSIPMKEAVARGDAAMDPKIRSEQTASNGPKGDPRLAGAYQRRYKGQTDRIMAYEQAGIKMGHEEAEVISRDTAMRDTSLQAAVYANTDRLMWVSYATYLEDGSIGQAYDMEYKLVPFRDYLPTLALDSSGNVWVHGDDWVPKTARDHSDYKINLQRAQKNIPYVHGTNLQVGDILELRLSESDYLVDRMEIK